jgi:hypothetical protein
MFRICSNLSDTVRSTWRILCKIVALKLIKHFPLHAFLDAFATFRKHLKFKFLYNLARLKGTLREDQYTFLILSCSLLLKMRKFFRQNCRENQNTFSFQKLFYSKFVPFMRKWKIFYSLVGYMWQYGACALHAGYLSLRKHTQNTAVFPRHQWLHEPTSMFHYPYIVRIVMRFIQYWVFHSVAVITVVDYSGWFSSGTKLYGI